MADFATALPYLLTNEGGYVNNPADRGGPTNAGVTQSTAAQYGYTGPMQSIPAATVASIYQAGFWNPGNLDAVADQNVATALLDGSADGWGNAGGVIQDALTAMGIANDGDGQWGPNTLAAVNSADPDSFLQALSASWRNKYAAIVANDPTQAQFLNGWNNRADRLLELQSGLAGYTAQVVNHPLTTALILIGIGAVAALLSNGRA